MLWARTSSHDQCSKDDLGEHFSTWSFIMIEQSIIAFGRICLTASRQLIDPAASRHRKSHFQYLKPRLPCPDQTNFIVHGIYFTTFTFAGQVATSEFSASVPVFSSKYVEFLVWLLREVGYQGSWRKRRV